MIVGLFPLLVLSVLVLLSLRPPECQEPITWTFHERVVLPCLGVLLAWLTPNPFAGLLIGYVALTDWLPRLPSALVSPMPSTGWLWITLYVLLSRAVTVEWIVPLCWLLMLWGVIQAGVVLQAVWTRAPRLDGWQGNPNHVAVLAALCTAAAVGLGVMGSVCAWSLALWTASPIVAIQSRDRHPSQGLLYLLLLGVVICWTADPILAGLLACSLLIGGLVLVWHRPVILSGRLEIWRQGWRLWTRLPWRVQGLGSGTGTWAVLMSPVQEQLPGGYLASTAHNEYVQCLVERGLIGFLLLLGYIGSVLWHVGHAGISHVPILLLVSVLAVAGAVSFPWTLYHEIRVLPNPAKSRAGHIDALGTPALSVFTLLICVLAEAA